MDLNKSVSSVEVRVLDQAPTTQQPSERNRLLLKLDNAKKSDEHKSFQNIATAMLTISTFAAGITFNILLKPVGDGQPSPAVIYLAYANGLFCAVIIGCALIVTSIELCILSIDGAEEVMQSDKMYKDIGQMINEALLGMHDNIGNLSKDETHLKPILERTLDSIQKMQNDHSSGAVTGINDSSEDTNEPSLHWTDWILGVEATVVGGLLFSAFYLLLLSSKSFLQINGPFIVGSIFYLLFGGGFFVSVGVALYFRHLKKDAARRRKSGDKWLKWFKDLVKRGEGKDTKSEKQNVKSARQDVKNEKQASEPVQKGKGSSPQNTTGCQVSNETA